MRALPFLVCSFTIALTPCCKVRFGSSGSTSFAQEAGEDRPCTRDDHCAPGSMCCQGRCAGCCSDHDCAAMDECRPGQCWEGTCRHDRPFSSPSFSAVVEMDGQIRQVRGMGSIGALVMDRSVLLADLRVPASARFLSSLSFPGRIRDFQISGALGMALVEEGIYDEPGIHIVDLSLPRFPRVSVVATLDDLRTAALDATTLIAVSPEGLHVVDVSSPADPVTLSKLDLSCPHPGSAALDGAQAVVACSKEGHVVVDLADPRKPSIIHRGSTLTLHVLGSRGRWLLMGPDSFLLTIPDKGPPRSEKVEVPDIRDFDGTWQMTLEGLGPFGDEHAQPLGGTLVAGDLSGGRAWAVVRDGEGRLDLVILQPGAGQSFTEKASMDLAPFTGLADAAFDGRHVAMAGPTGGILIVDASDPEAPRVDHSFVHEGKIVAVAWAGPDEIAVADGGGHVVFLDFSDRSSPPLRRTLDIGAADGAGVVDMRRTGDALAVTDDRGMLHVVLHMGMPEPGIASTIPLSGPSMIRSAADGIMLLASRTGSGSVFQTVALDAGGAPIGPASGAWKATGWPAATDGTHLFDSPGPAIRARPIEDGRPVTDGTLLEGFEATALLWHEGRLWAHWLSGLLALTADPAVEHVCDTRLVNEPGASLRPLEGGLALVSEDEVFFASTSLPPVPVSSRTILPESTACWSVGPDGRLYLGGDGWVRPLGGDPVEVTGKVADLCPRPGGLLATMGADGLAVLGLEDGRPVVQSTLGVDGRVEHAAAAGSAACVATDEAGLAVVDLTDPAHPAVTDRFGESVPWEMVAAAGLNCYAVGQERGILVVSVVDPKTPRLLGTLSTDQPLDADGGLWSAPAGLAVIEGRDLFLVDVSEPPAGTIVHSIRLPRGAWHFAQDGGLAAASGDRTWLLDLGGDQPALLGSVDIPGSWGMELILGPGGLRAAGHGTMWTLDLACLR